VTGACDPRRSFLRVQHELHGLGVSCTTAEQLHRGRDVRPDRWGWERTGHHRKVVWAELALCAHSL